MSSCRPVSIVIADDHRLFRQGLRELIETDVELRVIAEAGTSDEVVALAVSLKPRIVLLDVAMPGGDAHSTIASLRGVAPATRIIVLTMHDDPRLMKELLDCGAAAYLVKTISREELLLVLHEVSHGSDSAARFPTSEKSTGVPSTGRILTRRESDVLRLCAEAYSNLEIGRALGIAESTVKRHLVNVFAKLGAVSRLDAVRKGISRGEVSG